MLRPQPMVVLEDVEGGSAWFQSVLGLESRHGGNEYDMLFSGEEMVLQLHEWDTHEHPNLGDLNDPSRGNGLVLWFSVDSFDEAVERLTQGQATILEGPLHNPLAHHREVWLRGPEGYTVVLAGA